MQKFSGQEILHIQLLYTHDESLEKPKVVSGTDLLEYNYIQTLLIEVFFSLFDLMI